MDRPNYLLIFTDQQRYDTVGVNGAETCRTPVLDALAAEGANFTHAFTPTGLCTPARASLLTGSYPHKHRLLNNLHEEDAIHRDLPDGTVTFSQLLHDHGYRLGYLGKWHAGTTKGPRDWGFHDLPLQHDDAADVYEEMGGDVRVEDKIHLTLGDEQVVVAGVEQLDVGQTLSARLADTAIEQLRDYAERARNGTPFFLRVDFPGPHHPYIVPEPYASMYDPADVRLPRSFDQETFEDKPVMHRKLPRLRGVADFDADTWRVLIARYWGFVTLIDEQIGRILEAMEDLGLTDDTAVFSSTDHGDMIGAHRMFNKGAAMYDDVYRIPLIARWPGLTPPGTVSSSFARSLDLMPTFLEGAGIAVPEHIDGRSLVPLLRGEEPDDWPDDVLAEYHGDEWGLYTQRMLRTHDHKYVHNGPDIPELYDLREDPDELRNLADDPAHADLRRELEQRLLAQMSATDDGWHRWASRALGR